MINFVYLLWALSHAIPDQAVGTKARAPMDVSHAQTLLSARGDRVHTVLGRGPNGQRPSTAVLTCLSNAPEHIRAKGLSTDARAPELIVHPGQTACKALAPVPHQLFLWSQGADGDFEARLQAKFDLRGETGNTLWIDWHREDPAPAK